MEWQICLMEVTKIIFLADPKIICIIIHTKFNVNYELAPRLESSSLMTSPSKMEYFLLSSFFLHTYIPLRSEWQEKRNLDDDWWGLIKIEERLWCKSRRAEGVWHLFLHQIMLIEWEGQTGRRSFNTTTNHQIIFWHIKCQTSNDLTYISRFRKINLKISIGVVYLYNAINAMMEVSRPLRLHVLHCSALGEEVILYNFSRLDRFMW